MRRVEAEDIMKAVSDYSRNRGVTDEASRMPVDVVAASKSKELLAAIMKESPLGGKGGLTLDPHKGEGDDLDEMAGIITKGAKCDAPTGGPASMTSDEQKVLAEFEDKFRAYYARLLFFAFLTKSRVCSVEDIIVCMDKADNARISKNLEIAKPALKAIQKYFNKFILSEWDYKIDNLNALSRDDSLKPLERAQTAIRKFDRLGVSEIMTPEKIADDMVALFPEDELKRIAQSGEKILDIASKAGEFAIAFYKRYKKIDPNIDVSDFILSIPTSSHAYEFTRNVYAALGLNLDNIADKFTSYDLLEVKKSNGEIDYDRIKLLLTQKKAFRKITMNDKVSARGKHFTIAGAVGNPPYQMKGASGGTNDAPIYQDFSRIAYTAGANFSSLIIRANWFTGGRENLLGSFRKEMLGSGEVQLLHAFPNGSDVFPNAVEIKAGVCYYLRRPERAGLCDYYLHQGENVMECPDRDLSESDILIRDPRLAKIVAKVLTCAKNLGEEHFVSGILSGDTPFGIPTNPSKSSKTPFLTSETRDEDFNVRLDLLDDKLKRIVAYVRRSDIKKNSQDIDAYKVYIPAAGGSGNDPNVLSNPIVAPKCSACSQTFIYAKFDTKREADNFAGYLKTRFFRILVSARKIDQHAPSKVYSYVPMQDFTESWTDEKLYEKYGITESEQKFIESLIKPME